MSIIQYRHCIVIQIYLIKTRVNTPACGDCLEAKTNERKSRPINCPVGGWSRVRRLTGVVVAPLRKRWNGLYPNLHEINERAS